MHHLPRVISLLLLLLWGCDHGLDVGPPEGTGIKGTLIFHGTWLPETADVAVAAYRKRPQALEDFFSIAGWDTSVTIGVARYEYSIPLESPGAYEWIVVAWRPEAGFWDFRSLLGCYHVEGASLPTPVEVHLGETAKNVDIHAYFDLVRGADLPDRDICTGFLPPLPGLKPSRGRGRDADGPGIQR
jgi:hypothetical protein